MFQYVLMTRKWFLTDYEELSDFDKYILSEIRRLLSATLNSDCFYYISDNGLKQFVKKSLKLSYFQIQNIIKFEIKISKNRV